MLDRENFFARIGRSPSRSLLAVTLSFLAALAAHAWSTAVWMPSFAEAEAFGLAATLVLSAAVIAAVLCGGQAPALRTTVLCAAAFALGVLRYDAALASQPPRLPLPNGNVHFVGRISAEPRVGIKGTVLTLDRVFIVAEAAAEAGAAAPAGRKVLLTLRKPPALDIGDVVAWSCRPYLPLTDADDGPVASPWRCSSMQAPQLIEARQGFAVSNGLLRLKNGVRGIIRGPVPEPDASFVLGLLLGDTGGLPQDVVAEFRGVGASHVLAVSGFNVAIVAQFAFVFFALLRVPRRAAAVLVAAALAGFAALAGGGAPVVRAAVMGGVSVVAALLGRRSGGWGPLLFAAAGMLALQPLALSTDVGFKLSFAAVASMRAFGKLMERGLRFVPETFGLRGALGETVAATLGTLPISLHDFGSFPVAALGANVLIVPVVAFATGIGGLTLLLGAIGAAVGATWLALPAAFLVTLCTSFMRIVATYGNAIAPAIPAQASTFQAMLLTGFLLLLWYAGTRLPEPERAV